MGFVTVALRLEPVVMTDEERHVTTLFMEFPPAGIGFLLIHIHGVAASLENVGW